MKTFKMILMVSALPLAMACEDPVGPTDDQIRVEESGVIVHRPQTSGVIVTGPRMSGVIIDGPRMSGVVVQGPRFDSVATDAVGGQATREGYRSELRASLAPGIETSPGRR